MDPDLGRMLYSNLEIFHVDEPKWRNNVRECLGYFELSTSDPLLSLLKWVKASNCATIVLEKDYVDQDFLDEFQFYYSQVFRPIEARCMRLHFFSKKISDIGALVEGDNTDPQESYLGFSVIRPTFSFRTGRTILKSPHDNGNTKYTLCKARYDINLSGLSLTIRGMPFVQQDTNVCVCAQAAIWMASLYMHQKFSSPRFKPSQITEKATKYLTVGQVRDGLGPTQIITALRDMGYNPLLFKHLSVDETSRIIYCYMESGIPVILLLKHPRGGHAVVVIGHDFKVRKNPSSNYNLNIDWISHFYIHDDAQGPYQQLSIKKSSQNEYSVENDAAFTVVLAPVEVKMRADDVMEHVHRIMEIEILNLLVESFQGAKDFKFSEMELTGLVFRTYLCISNDFKAQFGSPSPLFRNVCRSMRMPRYVWITEISNFKNLNHSNSKNRKMLGEIVIDSTADRHTRLASFLYIHLLGRMIVKLPDEIGPSELYIDPAEKPYNHLVRRP